MPESLATEHVLANLGLPDQSLIAAVIREGFTSVPGADHHFLPGDSAIVLAADDVIKEVETFFDRPHA